MSAKEIFGLILRFIGLVGLLYTCRHIYLLIHKTGSWHMGWLLHTWGSTGEWDAGELRALILEVLLIAFGVYLMLGAPLLMKVIYPDEKKDADGQDSKSKV